MVSYDGICEKADKIDEHDEILIWTIGVLDHIQIKKNRQNGDDVLDEDAREWLEKMNVENVKAEIEREEIPQHKPS